MTKAPARDRRRRRIASDEAHAWARNLKLYNPYAKSVLRALASYVDEFGSCHPGISTIAADTDLSDDTVRKRLKFLEEVGAIVRFPRWRDEQGRENTDGRGKRTTDDIRLLIDSDPEDVEARANGESVPDQGSDDTNGEGEGGPLPQRGLNSDAEMRSPAPALGQPSDSRKGLISEPEPEDSPQAPLAGGCEPVPETEQASEPEHFAEFWQSYPEHEVMATSRSKALALFRSMTSLEREHARVAVLLLADQLRKLKRKPKNAHLWLQAKGWQEYPNAKLPEATSAPEPVWYADDDPEIAALRVAHSIARLSPPNLRGREGHVGNWIKRLCPLGADLLALTAFTPEDCDQFAHLVEEGSNEFGAWRTKLSKWIGHEVGAIKIWLEPHNPEIHDVPFSHPSHRFRKAAKGFRVPWRWPPRKDGTLIDDSEGEQG